MNTNPPVSNPLRRVWLTLAIAIFIGLEPARAQTADSFNPGANAAVFSLAVQVDGKVLAGGDFTSLGGQTRYHLGRVNANGSADPTFNPGADSIVNCLAVQPDGKILAGGAFYTLGGQTRSFIGRLNADGSLDATFNPGANGPVQCLAVQADGKILVGGSFSMLGGQTRNSIGRLNADGSLDTSFNPGADSIVASLAVQADGKIVAGGAFMVLGGQPRSCIGRLNADGSLDMTFNPGANNQVNCLAVQADGKILAGGWFSLLGGQPRNYIGRLDAVGGLDASFNPGTNNGVNYSVYSLAVQADGKILAGGGFTQFGGQPRNYIGRLNANGSLDATFNPGTNNGVNSSVLSLAVQADGKVLAGGSFTILGGSPRGRIGRLNNTEPATEILTFTGSAISWSRGGTSPEVWRTTFDVSTNGTDWASSGAGERIPGGWVLTGLSHPLNASIRARGFVAGGHVNGSCWLVESSIGPVMITGQPADRTNNAGTAVAFKVEAIGTPPLTYHWRKGAVDLGDGGNVFGAHTASLILSNAWGADAGEYSVVVSNLYGAVTSSVAILTVVDPAILQPPVSQVVNWGDTAYFSVTAEGTKPLGYQWRKDGIDQTGKTNSTLSLTNVQASTAGDYVVVISNLFGSVTSVVATLTVIDPAIVDGPYNQNVSPGESAWFEVWAVGAPPLGYRWRKDGIILPGATNSILTLNNVQGPDAGYYDVIVTNVSGSRTSQVATLTVNLATLDDFDLDVEGEIYTFAVQPDGKILVGGDFWELAGQPCHGLGRLNADGSPDTTFTVGGTNAEILDAWGFVYSLTVQSDGKILVGGDYYFRFASNGQEDEISSIARLNNDGSLDATFNPSADGTVYSLAVQADGRILVGGEFWYLNGQERHGIGRLNANGTLNTSFNPHPDGSVYALAVLSDGRILVGGEFWELAGQPCYNLGRLNADGSLDATFTAGGTNAIILDAWGSVYTLTEQSDGRILVGGDFYFRFEFNGQEDEIYDLARLNNDGSIDATFLDPNPEGSVYSLAVQSNGKILVSGEFWMLGGLERNNIGRLNVDGSPDITFNPGADGAVYSLAVQSDGKILVSGSFWWLNGQEWYRIGRLNNTDEATQELTFDGATVTWVRGGASPEVWRAAFDSSTNGTNWISLGEGVRVGNAWQRTSVSVPVNSVIRARGFMVAGRRNSSGSIVESVVSPPMIVVHPVSQAVELGQTVEFSVTATGMPPLSCQWLKDGVPMPGVTSNPLILSNVQPSDSALYSALVSSPLGWAASSNATLTVIIPLGVALDAPALTWISGGYVPWLGHTVLTHDGVDVARSGVIGHNQYSWVETTVTGPGTLSFWWKVSSEPDYDVLEFRVNGILVDFVSGEIPWQQRTVDLAQGTQTLRWCYVKDFSLQGGKDFAWLDQVSFSSAAAPTIVKDASLGFSSDCFGFNISGAPGNVVVVEGSTNLVHWTPLGTNTLGSIPCYFGDYDAMNFPQRFYRLRLE